MLLTDFWFFWSILAGTAPKSDQKNQKSVSRDLLGIQARLVSRTSKDPVAFARSGYHVGNNRIPIYGAAPTMRSPLILCGCSLEQSQAEGAFTAGASMRRADLRINETDFLIDSLTLAQDGEISGQEPSTSFDH